MKPKHIYLAALFSRRPEMETIAEKIKQHGLNVCARWVYGGEEGLTREQIALLDIEDVDKADTVVSYTQPHGTANFGGGRHTEYGYALAKGKTLVIIGEREQVFHHHPSVAVYPTIEAWLESLAGDFADAA